MNWKASLDRYLTTEPFDYNFESWAELVIEYLSPTYYDANKDWIDSVDFDNVLNSFYHSSNNDPDHVAKLIEIHHERK